MDIRQKDHIFYLLNLPLHIASPNIERRSEEMVNKEFSLLREALF